MESLGSCPLSRWDYGLELNSTAPIFPSVMTLAILCRVHLGTIRKCHNLQGNLAVASKASGEQMGKLPRDSWLNEEEKGGTAKFHQIPLSELGCQAHLRGAGFPSICMETSETVALLRVEDMMGGKDSLGA